MRHSILPSLPFTLILSTGAWCQSLEMQPREIPAGSHTYDGFVGRMAVPQFHDDPESGSLELAVLVLASTADEPGPPTFYLNGIPNAATSLGESEGWIPFLALGDVVLVDQRGAGRSNPQLTWDKEGYRGELLFADYETAKAHALETAAEIRAFTEEMGVHLAAFNTRESARDIDAIREALGYETIRIVGHSGGSHLGFEVVRLLGDQVERFVSLGTAGPNDIDSLPSQLDASLKLIGDLAREDPRIGADTPDVYASAVRARAELDREPLLFTVLDPRTNEEVQLELGGHGLMFILTLDLGDPSEIALFPRLFHELEQGRTDVLSWFVEQRYRQMTTFPALLFVNRGASGATPERWKRIRKEAKESPFGLLRCLFSPEIDDVFGIDDLGDDFRAPVESDVPVLFISGSLDGKTPPERAERARAGFERSAHVILENGGHNEVTQHPEAQARIVAFLAGSEVEDEVVLLPPIRFALLEGEDPLVDHPALDR